MVRDATDRVECSASCGCDREAAPRRTLCWGHIKQQRRLGRLTPLRPRLEVREQLFVAALALTPDDDGDLEAAERRFWDAFRRAAREDAVGELVQLVRFTWRSGRRAVGR